MHTDIGSHWLLVRKSLLHNAGRKLKKEKYNGSELASILQNFVLYIVYLLT